MNQEEILIRMGLDPSSLKSGMQKATGEIENFANRSSRTLEHSAEGMQHLEHSANRTKLHFAELVKSLASGNWEGAVMQFGRIAGHMGTISRFVFGLPGAIIGGSLLVFSKMKEQLSEVNQELDKEGNQAAIGYGKMRESFAEASREGAKSAEEFADHINKAASAQTSLKERTEETVRALHEQEAAQQELISAQSAADLARINRMEEEGQLSPEQAIRARASIKSRASQDAETNKTRGLLGERRQVELASMDASSAQATALAGASSAEALAFSSPEAIRRRALLLDLPKQRADLERDLDERKKALAEAQKKYEASPEYQQVQELRRIVSEPSQNEDFTFRAKVSLNQAEGQLRPLTEKLAEQQSAVELLTSAISQNEQRQISIGDTQRHLEDSYKRALEAYDKATDQVRELSQALAKVNEEIGLRDRTRPGLQSAASSETQDQLVSDLLKTPTGKAILGAQMIARKMAAGAPVSDSDVGNMTLLEYAIAGGPVSVATAKAMALASMNDSAFLAQQQRLSDISFEHAPGGSPLAQYLANLQKTMDALALLGTDRAPIRTIARIEGTND